MPKLTDVNGIGSNKAEKLESKGINTVEQLSVKDPEEIKIIMNSTLATAKKIIKSAKDLTKDSIQLISGKELYEDRKARVQAISTNSVECDALFREGGIPTDALTALFGQFATGKTQWCLQIAINMKRQFGRKIAWIETEPRTLVFDRLLEIAKSQGTNIDLRNDIIAVPAKFMETPSHMFMAYEEIENKIKMGADIGLIVIDSFNALFRSAYPGRTMLGLRSQEQGRHIGFLQKLASKYNLAVVITLQVMGVPDSVPDYTPILIKDKNGVDILPIGELWERNKIIAGNIQGREFKNIHDIKVFGKRNRWTNIKKIIRHKYNSPLKRINTTSGLLDTSPNHSIYKHNKIVDAKDIEIGDVLNEQTLPSRAFNNNGLFIGNKELAWLYGFFSGDGVVYTYQRSNKWNNQSYCVDISNENINLLDKAKRYLKTYFNFNSSIDKKNNRLRISSKIAYQFFLNNFYHSRKHGVFYKRVPTSILNASKEIKESYLEGYNDGAGRPQRHDWKIEEFSTSSQVLAAGLKYLVDCVLNRSTTVRIREDKPSISLTINKNPINLLSKRGAVKKILDIDYKGYLYDLKTKSGAFTAGIGPLTAHNSGQQLGAIKRYGTRDVPVASHVLKHGVNYLIGLEQVSSVDKTWKAVVADGPVARTDCIFVIDDSGIRDFSKRKGVR